MFALWRSSARPWSALRLTLRHSVAEMVSVVSDYSNTESRMSNPVPLSGLAVELVSVEFGYSHIGSRVSNLVPSLDTRCRLALEASADRMVSIQIVALAHGLVLVQIVVAAPRIGVSSIVVFGTLPQGSTVDPRFFWSGQGRCEGP